jgi:hypothetical protein
MATVSTQLYTTTPSDTTDPTWDPSCPGCRSGVDPTWDPNCPGCRSGVDPTWDPSCPGCLSGIGPSDPNDPVKYTGDAATA